MGLNEIRILEDLKSEYEDLLQKYKSMRSSYIDELIKRVADEFADFFCEAKFSIQRYQYEVSATYGHSTACLKYDELWKYEGVDIGMIINTNFASQSYRKYLVALNKASGDEEHTKKVGQNIYEEIEITKLEIYNLEKIIADGSFETYQLYGKREETGDPFDSYLKPYNSLTEFLVYITR